MGKIAKAVAGGLAAAGSAAAAALQDGQVTLAEAVTVLVAGIAAGWAVWAVPNTPPGGDRHG